MPSEGDIVRVRVRVTGVVQGVYFRQETRRLARSLNVAGWVRNLPDGSLESVFEGAPERVEWMVAWCRRGPVLAQVDEIVATPEPPEAERGFSIR